MHGRDNYGHFQVDRKIGNLGMVRCEDKGGGDEQVISHGRNTVLTNDYG